MSDTLHEDAGFVPVTSGTPQEVVHFAPRKLKCGSELGAAAFARGEHTLSLGRIALDGQSDGQTTGREMTVLSTPPRRA